MRDANSCVVSARVADPSVRPGSPDPHGPAAPECIGSAGSAGSAEGIAGARAATARSALSIRVTTTKHTLAIAVTAPAARPAATRVRIGRITTPKDICVTLRLCRHFQRGHCHTVSAAQPSNRAYRLFSTPSQRFCQRPHPPTATAAVVPAPQTLLPPPLHVPMVPTLSAPMPPHLRPRAPAPRRHRHQRHRTAPSTTRQRRRRQHAVHALARCKPGATPSGPASPSRGRHSHNWTPSLLEPSSASAAHPRRGELLVQRPSHCRPADSVGATAAAAATIAAAAATAASSRGRSSPEAAQHQRVPAADAAPADARAHSRDGRDIARARRGGLSFARYQCAPRRRRRDHPHARCSGEGGGGGGGGCRRIAVVARPLSTRARCPRANALR